MNKIIFLLFFYCQSLYAQTTEPTIFCISKDFAVVDQKVDFTYYLIINKDNDTTYTHHYYYRNASLYMTNTFRDKDADTANGLFAWYNPLGFIDSLGNVYNNMKNGTWAYYDSYSAKPESAISLIQYSNGIRYSLPKVINTQDKFVAPSFKNWSSFLNNNLRYPETSMKNNSSGIIIVNFVVLPNGKVENVYVSKSVDYFLDNEAINVIKKTSGKWTPGMKNDIPTITYHSQSINFVIPN